MSGIAPSWLLFQDNHLSRIVRIVMVHRLIDDGDGSVGLLLFFLDSICNHGIRFNVWNGLVFRHLLSFCRWFAGFNVCNDLFGVWIDHYKVIVWDIFHIKQRVRPCVSTYILKRVRIRLQQELLQLLPD